MFLSKIELHGFKSFADKTVFDFSSGITAVLGPNGCGKSNVVDAVKWVLGESKAKSLRGSSMQDVIFAGAAHRKPMGMAEVNLYFDNSSGKLPVEYNEVCVSRRLYRSGESEYLINKRPCRRRDILELLMDTGIGTTAYSIIEQGKVEALLHAKPQERRAVFEEAAGITKYKERRKRTLARLDRTEQCLLRVNDIVEELDRGVRRLNRQASAARRHRRLTTEMQVLKKHLYARTCRSLQEELDTIQKEHAELNQLFTRESGEIGRLSQKLAELTDRETTFSTQAEEKEQALLSVQEELGSAQAEASRVSERLASLKREHAEADERIARLAASLEEYETEIARTGEETAETVAKRESLDRDLADREARRTSIQEQALDKDRAVTAIREEIRALTDALHKIETEKARFETESSGMNERLAALETRAASIDQDAQSIQDQLRQLGEEKGALDRSGASLIERLNASKAQRERLQADTQRFAEELNQASQEKSARAGRLETLKDLEDNLAGAHAGVKNILTAKREGHPACQEVHGIIADLMQVSQEHALAVETTAGGQAQDVVVSTDADAQACIEHLKETRGGRATFLPLNRIRPHRRVEAHLRSLPGVVGEAIDLVQFDEQYRPAMEYVLAGILVVTDLSTARDLSRDRARGIRLVTLDGDVITQHGAMTGGSGRRNQGGLITRKAEIDALSAEIGELDTRIREATSSRDACIAAANTARQETESLEAQIAELAKQQRTVEQNLSLAENEASRLAREKEGMSGDIETLRTGLASLVEREQDLQHRETALAENIGAKESALATAIEAQQTAAVELDRIREEVSAMRETRATLESRHGELVRRRESLVTTLEDRRRELDELKQFIGRADEDKARLAEAQETHQETVRQLLVKRDDMKESLITLREQAHGLRQLLEESRSEERAHQRRIDEIREAQNKLSLRETESRMKLESIDEKALEELEIESFSQHADSILAEIAEIAMSVDDDEEDTPDTPQARAVESLADGDTPLPQMSDAQLRTLIQDVSAKLDRIGPVNLCAIDELTEMEARRDFLLAEQEDLQSATKDLQQVIDRLNDECQRRFTETFETVRTNFQDMFVRLFNGGKADIVLEQPEGEHVDPLDMGIDVIARPPGKEAKKISLLSGGEKALCTVALLFAIFRSKPSPFCILDEVDGPLDESNIDIFMKTVKEFSSETQFLVITHAKRTMSMTDTIYGVTQKEPGVSSHYSLSFAEMYNSVTDEENRSALDGEPLPQQDAPEPVAEADEMSEAVAAEM